MSIPVYIIAPLAGYLGAGGLKFLINSAKLRRPAFRAIGLGGFPSTHNSITASTAATIAFTEGVSAPAFGVAATLAMIVAIDAMDLRRKIGRQAEAIRRIASDDAGAQTLRTSMGHRPVEVLAGWLVGAAIGFVLSLLPG